MHFLHSNYFRAFTFPDFWVFFTTMMKIYTSSDSNNLGHSTFLTFSRGNLALHFLCSKYLRGFNFPNSIGWWSCILHFLHSKYYCAFNTTILQGDLKAVLQFLHSLKRLPPVAPVKIRSARSAQDDLHDLPWTKCTICTGRSARSARDDLHYLPGTICTICLGRNARSARDDLPQMIWMICPGWSCPGC